MTRKQTVKALAKEYAHFDPASFRHGLIQVFNTDTCEICGATLCAPNGCSISASVPEMLAAGMTALKRPDEGGYSELHNAATCEACCYDPEARARAAQAAAP